MEYLLSISFFIMASQVVCNSASPLLPVDNTLGKYQVEKRQVCTPDQFDKFKSCAGWKAIGWCIQRSTFMRINCYFTCGNCRMPPSPPTSPPSPTAAPNSCVQAHNAKRALHGSTPMVWNDMLAQHAQAWANHLAATETFVHDPNTDEGENLYSAEGPTARNCSVAVEAWYSEEPLYDYGRPPQTLQEFQEAEIGHFTQIVWKATTMVGVGIATIGGGMTPIQTYVVARYLPRGNILGQFATNVARPINPPAFKRCLK
ncbi:hypothetical protein ACROYT_G009908 [Oculina patagonica]